MREGVSPIRTTSLSPRLGGSSRASLRFASREFRPEVLVSSTFLRARQTSEIIAAVLGIETETIPGIQERNFGCLKGQPYERLGLRRGCLTLLGKTG